MRITLKRNDKEIKKKNVLLELKLNIKTSLNLHTSKIIIKVKYTLNSQISDKCLTNFFTKNLQNSVSFVPNCKQGSNCIFFEFFTPNSIL